MKDVARNRTAMSGRNFDHRINGLSIKAAPTATPGHLRVLFEHRPWNQDLTSDLYLWTHLKVDDEKRFLSLFCDDVRRKIGRERRTCNITWSWRSYYYALRSKRGVRFTRRGDRCYTRVYSCRSPGGDDMFNRDLQFLSPPSLSLFHSIFLSVSSPSPPIYIFSLPFSYPSASFLSSFYHTMTPIIIVLSLLYSFHSFQIVCCLLSFNTQSK